jgi:hypothetical protein
VITWPFPRGGAREGCLLTLLATIASVPLCACSPAERSPAWRSEQELLIAKAVLMDLAALPPDPHDPEFTPKSFCVFVGVDEKRYYDPPAGLLEMLSPPLEEARPFSRCLMKDWVVVEDGTSTRVAAIGVIGVEWETDSFVRAEGSRAIGPTAGASWKYTLSHTSDGWVVDTVRQEYIY